MSTFFVKKFNEWELLKVQPCAMQTIVEICSINSYLPEKIKYDVWFLPFKILKLA